MAVAARAWHQPDHAGTGNPGPRSVRGYRRVPDSTARRRNATADARGRSLEAVVRDRPGAGGIGKSTGQSRRHPRCRVPGGDEPGDQPVRQAAVEAPAAQPHIGSARPPDPSIPDVQLAAVGALGECGRIRRRRRPGKPSPRPGPGAAGRVGGVVAGSHGCALSGRRAGRFRDRRRCRSPGRSPRSAGGGDETPCHRAASDRDTATPDGQGSDDGGQSRIGQRHRRAGCRRGPKRAARREDRRTGSRRRPGRRSAFRRRGCRGAGDRGRRRHGVDGGGDRRGRTATACGVPSRHVQSLRQGHRMRHRGENCCGRARGQRVMWIWCGSTKIG